jgi:hypothetical protein
LSCLDWAELDLVYMFLKNHLRPSFYHLIDRAKEALPRMSLRKEHNILIGSMSPIYGPAEARLTRRQRLGFRLSPRPSVKKSVPEGIKVNLT